MTSSNPFVAAHLAANATDQFDPTAQAAVELVANALTTNDGLTHPNRPDVPLQFPGLRTAGLSDQMAEAVKTAGRSLAEAMVHLVTKQLDATLIDNTELDALRTAAADARPEIVHLTCDHGELLTVHLPPGVGASRIDCTRLRASLRECEP